MNKYLLSKWTCILLACLLIPACASYQSKALQPQLILKEVESLRILQNREVDLAYSLSFSSLLEKMHKSSPDFLDTLAAYHSAQRQSQLSVPWPNPSISFGPQWGFGSDANSTHEIAPFGSLSLSIPTAGKRHLAQEVLQATNNQAKTYALSQFRELYLRLRRSFAQAILARESLKLQQELVESADSSSILIRKMVESGSATAADATLLDLEKVRLKIEEHNLLEASLETMVELSRQVGIRIKDLDPLDANSLPAQFPTLPSQEELKDRLLREHPALGRLRADYELSEKQLELEYAKQYPDIQIGPQLEGENGQKSYVLGLAIGIEIPLFDRNQLAISEAYENRELTLSKFRNELSRRLSQLEHAMQQLKLATDRKAYVECTALPAADQAMEIAIKSLEAGTSSAIKILEAARSQNILRQEYLKAELNVWQAWIMLESAIGFPLLNFPNLESPSSQNPHMPIINETQVIN